ncbi:G8 domain-containing protein [Halomicroarcula sp. GCM10025710]
MVRDDERDTARTENSTADAASASSRFRPSRRTVLSALGAGLAGAAVTNPDIVAGLLRGLPALDDEHDSPLALVPKKQMTHTAAESGAWSDPAVWDGDSPPDEGAWVHVPADVTVTLASETARLKALRVDGTLAVDPATDTHLTVETVVTTPGSTLTIGTADDPVRPDATATVTFADFGSIDEDWDPERVSRGLVAMGDLSIHGTEKTAWTELASHPTAGDRTLELPTPPMNWAPGDELVVPGVSFFADEDERVTVTSVDGATVTLDRPLQFDHVPPRESFDAYVLSVSRNVRLASENTAVPRRGHVMVHGTESAVRYAAFEGLGRTDKSYPFTNGNHGTPPKDVPPNPKARYALHYHKTGIGESPHVVEGAVVDGSPGWGVVNHHSHAEVRDSITLDVFGSGFVAEAGNERGVFERNFALRSEGSGETMKSREFQDNGEPGHVDDFGHGGHGFWLQGSQVALRENVAAGHRHHGFAFWNRSLVDRPLEADESIGDRADDIENYPVEFVEGRTA